MSRLSIILACALLGISMACSDLSEVAFTKNDVSYVAVLKDTVLSGKIVPARKISIFLTNQDHDTTRYAVKVTTDSTGRFLFDHVPKGKEKRKYFIYAHYYSNGILYQSRFRRLDDMKDTLEVVPRYQPGIKIILEDSISRSPIAAVPVCLYQSAILFENADCSGSITSKYSNARGVVFFDGLTSGQYQVKVKAPIGNIILSGKAKINFKSDSNVKILLRLQQVGVSLTVRDSLSRQPMPGVNVCFFASQTLAADTICQGSIQTIATDRYGRAFFGELSVGTHYFVVDQKINDVKLKGVMAVNYHGSSLSTDFLVAPKSK